MHSPVKSGSPSTNVPQYFHEGLLMVCALFITSEKELGIFIADNSLAKYVNSYIIF